MSLATAPSKRSPAGEGSSVDLFTWQREALEAWRRAGRRGVVQAVTGAGKTRIGVAAVAEAVAEGRQAVVIVPTRVLVRQWLATLRQLLPAVEVSSDPKDPSAWQVLVTTVQTAMLRPMLPFGHKGLLVADECHRYGAESFSQALRSGFTSRLGLTATLQRGDDGDDILEAYFGGIVMDLGYERALADELIAPFKFAYVSVPLEASERIAYDEMTEELREARSKLVMRYNLPSDPMAAFLQAVSQLAEDRTPGSGGGLARLYMARFSARKKLLAETRMKQLALAGLSPAVRESKGSIVFTQTQESSLNAAELLQQTGCTAAAVHGAMEAEEREERIDLFRQGDVTALTAPRILDEGVDVPEADLGIVMAANRSRRQMIQRLGRVLRRRPDKLARFVVLYAENSVEDPFSSGHIPDFYEECVPFAHEFARFDLAQDDLDPLLDFLDVRDHGDAIAAQGRIVAASKRASECAPATGDSGTAAAAGRAEVDAALNGHFAQASVFEDEGIGEVDPWEERLSSSPPVTDLVKYYLQQIGRAPLLSAEEEVQLALSVEAGLYAQYLIDTGDTRRSLRELTRLVVLGSQARERLIVSNLRLVVSLAKRYTGRGLEFLDLIQEGNIGLIRAVEKFDFQQATKFSTYATWWIKQALTRGLADLGRVIRIPVHMNEKLVPVRRYRARLDVSWGELLRSHKNGIPDLDVNAAELRRLAHLAQPIISTDAIQEEIEDSLVLEPILGDGPAQPEAIVEAMARRAEYLRIILPLEHEDPRGAFVLRARHGLVTGEPETLEAIGARLRVTRERVRQIEKAMMSRARQLAGLEEDGSVPTSPPPVAPKRAAFHLPPTPGTARPRRASLAS